MADELTIQQQVEQLLQEQNARLNQLANADPIINRIAGKLEVLQSMAQEEGVKLTVTEAASEDGTDG